MPGGCCGDQSLGPGKQQRRDMRAAGEDHLIAAAMAVLESSQGVLVAVEDQQHNQQPPPYHADFELESVVRQPKSDSAQTRPGLLA